MSGASYTGDDIGAVVIDIGSHSCRVGYSGEEHPRHDIPSQFSSYQTPDNITKNIFGTVGLHARIPNAEIRSFLTDGVVENWNAFEEYIAYVFTNVLRSSPELHPILFSEPAWIPPSKREELAELMFEKYNSPAFQVGSTPVLVGVAHNRPTCLVLDSGAVHTTAVPVHEGFIISQAMIRSSCGGNVVLDKIKRMLVDKGLHITPYYRVASKQVVKADEPANYEEKNYPVHHTWHNFMVKEVLQEFQTSVLQITDVPYEDDLIKNVPSAHFEFPTGYHTDFDGEHFKVAEAFYSKACRSANGTVSDLSSMVVNSIAMCDTDLRPVLYGNVLLTGGNSKIQGFADRLTKDLQSRIPPSMRLKVTSQYSPGTDRRFTPWFGGSIVTSLGRFQSLWISKQGYEEHGKTVVNLMP